MMVRIADHLKLPLWAVGEMSIADYLDQADAYSYLVDLDNPPRWED